MGINPMYVGTDSEDRFYVASEMKALVKVCDSVKEFPPRHYIYSKDGDYSFNSTIPATVLNTITLRTTPQMLRYKKTVLWTQFAVS